MLPVCAFTFWVPWCDVRHNFRINTMLVSFLLPVSVEGVMSYLRYMCLFVHSGVQRMLCCVFVLFFVVFCAKCWQFVWIVQIGLPLRFSLKLIYSVTNAQCYLFLWIVHSWLSLWFSLTCIYSIYTLIYFANHNMFLSNLHNVVELYQQLKENKTI